MHLTGKFTARYEKTVENKNDSDEKTAHLNGKKTLRRQRLAHLDPRAVRRLRPRDGDGTGWSGSFDKFRETGLSPLAIAEVAAQIVGESPVNIECRVTQILPLGSYDMFPTQVDATLLDPATGRFCLEQAEPIVYSHGEYFVLNAALGNFGRSVHRKRKKRRTAAKNGRTLGSQKNNVYLRIPKERPTK
ncbi:MAG: hypothetical protein K2K30_02825 [Alistipes sp.]|nr:hypothetical protein [Alistipes sp.]